MTKEEIQRVLDLALEYYKSEVFGTNKESEKPSRERIDWIYDKMKGDLEISNDLEEAVYNGHRDPCGLRGPSGVDSDKDWYLLDQEIIDWCGKFSPSIQEEIQATAYHFADWQKEQMMNEAVKGEITKDNRGNNVLRVGSLNNGFEIGDKVRIIIVKED